MYTEQGFIALVWNAQYVTGIAEVDDQHLHLVELINKIGKICTIGRDSPEVKPILDELARYTNYHFSTEEKLMEKFALDAAHMTSHCKAHKHFRQQVAKAAGIVADTPGTSIQLLSYLLEYLTNWLLHHVMGMDMRMAREIQELQTGASHSDAAINAAALMDKSADELLDTMNELYGKLGDKMLEVMRKNQELKLQHKALLELNEQLDQRVQLRTTELENALAQLLQSEKMASIGQLAAGVAHEINNPIGFVSSNLGTLRHYIENLLRMLSAYEKSENEITPETREALAELKQQTDITYLREDVGNLLSESMDGLQRVKRIVQDLKDFSHVDENGMQSANLEQGLDSTLNVVGNELKYKTKVVKEYGGIPNIECIPAQLNQVFMNLLVNAVQAIENHGQITIRTGQEEAFVWVEVEDTGKGINPEHLDRIFDPFFTTKPVGSGTGLGLSLSYGIVQKHGGRIEVKSEVGKGTTMRVWLPAKPDDACHNRNKTPLSQADGI